jgi:hypothetical protein
MEKTKMTRTEYIEALLPEVRQSIVHFVGPENERRARAKLDEYTTNELAIMYSKQKAAEQAPTPPAPSATWADVERAKQELQRDRERAEERRLDQKLHSDAAVASQRTLHEIRERDRLEPQDRKTFADAAKTLRFGMNQANFNLIRETLGPGFDVYGIKRAIGSGQLLLTTATQSELDQWHAEAVEAHNQALHNASPTELRQAVRAEGARTALEAQAEAQKESDIAHQARDAARRYPPLPTERNGKPLDASFIKRADKTELRYLLQRYGESAVTARLRQG